MFCSYFLVNEHISFLKFSKLMINRTFKSMLLLSVILKPLFRILIKPNKNCKIPPLYLIVGVGIDWEIQRIAGNSSDHRNHLTWSFHRSPAADTTADNSNSPQQQHGRNKEISADWRETAELWQRWIMPAHAFKYSAFPFH